MIEETLDLDKLDGQLITAEIVCQDVSIFMENPLLDDKHDESTLQHFELINLDKSKEILSSETLIKILDKRWAFNGASQLK